MLTGLIRDDFAGPGGWESGLALLGITNVVGVEFDADACATAEAAGHRRIHADVRAHHPGLKWLAGYIASPPCQTFSAAGKGGGRRGLAHLLDALHLVAQGWDPDSAVTLTDAGQGDLDERSVLVLHPLTVIRDARPPWVALEQVPAVLPVWEAYAEVLRGWGYSVVTALLQAEQYGVPQTRKRAVLLAHREQEVALPTPTHSRFHVKDRARMDAGVLPWVSMAEALGFGLDDRPAPTITGGGTEAGGAEPIAHLSRWTDSAAWRMRPSALSNAAVRLITEPAPTITGAHDTAQRCWETPETEGSRALRVTVEEAGVLQSFAPDYPWAGRKTSQYQQVGNAIPPLLAAACLRELVGVTAEAAETIRKDAA